MTTQQITEIVTLICTTITAILAYLGHSKNAAAIAANKQDVADVHAGTVLAHAKLDDMAGKVAAVEAKVNQ